MSSGVTSLTTVVLGLNPRTQDMEPRSLRHTHVCVTTLDPRVKHEGDDNFCGEQ